MIRIAQLYVSFLLSLIFCACFVSQVEAFTFDQAPTKIIMGLVKLKRIFPQPFKDFLVHLF
ncbi:MAG: hypothetical protein COU68_00580, partial [Candidatus Pacebacteria bacterium CG10_big_fil_rev_8_21_14_0_10_45_6]